MQSNRNSTRVVKTLAVGIRPAQPRMGTTHTYELNGTRIATCWSTANGCLFRSNRSPVAQPDCGSFPSRSRCCRTRKHTTSFSL